jgi:prepilin-type N-terminal cleavage/methylation domain-containing protein/prepilin-type processing-associated H-X9-DG protein
LGGFTLVELLLVVAIIGLLAAMLMPALSSAASKGRKAGCLNNLKQLEIAAHLYAGDNDGRLPENQLEPSPETRNTNAWVLGNMASSQESTNAVLIRRGKLFPYASQTTLYRCPADPSNTRGVPRVRSYSMNGWMGSRYMELNSINNGFRTFLRETELASSAPACLWVIADEHEGSIDDAFFLVTMDNSRPFASFPATRHDKGYSLTFADGHAETYKLRDPKTRFSAGLAYQISPENADWLKLKQVTTTR